MRIFGAVLAAGRGERMRISTPKPLFPLLGRPMIHYALDALRQAGVTHPIVITSPALKPVLQQTLRNVAFVVQPQPLGTGDAVLRVKPMVSGKAVLVVINADSPLFDPGHVGALLRQRAESGAQVSFATATVEDPTGLGRVLRDPAGAVANIVEESEASDAVRRIREINAGLYAFEAPAIFSLLDEVPLVGPKRERYLTRAVELALARGFSVATVRVPADASSGVNTLAEAAFAQAVLQSRKLAVLMTSGVIIDDPANVTVDWDVAVGPESRILPGTTLAGTTRAGSGCVLGPHSVIRDADLGDRVTVGASWVTSSRLEDDVAVGPFAHIRPGSVVKRGAHVGTHAEIVRTTLGEQTRMHHFSYLGDAVVGAGTNIGAGAISANYDGKKKWPTRIGKKAFIGSGAVLVAPATVGDGATVGAGAVVPAGRKVAPGTVVAGVPARLMKRKGGQRAK